MSRLNEALRIVREYHRLNLNEGAAKVGASPSTISMIESGKRKPSVKMLEAYATAYRVPESGLFFLGEQMAKAPIARPVDRTIDPKVVRILNWVADLHEENEK